MILLNLAGVGYRRMVRLVRSADGIFSCPLVPSLGTNQIEPAETVTVVLAHAFVQNIVYGDGRWRGGCKFVTVVGIHLLVPVHTVVPLAGTCSQYVDEFACGFASRCTLDGSFGGDEVEFGEFGYIERT